MISTVEKVIIEKLPSSSYEKKFRNVVIVILITGVKILNIKVLNKKVQCVFTMCALLDEGRVSIKCHASKHV